MLTSSNAMEEVKAPSSEEAALNSLVSPCKKLKLGPPLLSSTFQTPTVKASSRSWSDPLCCSTPLSAQTSSKPNDRVREPGVGETNADTAREIAIGCEETGDCAKSTIQNQEGTDSTAEIEAIDHLEKNDADTDDFTVLETSDNVHEIEDASHMALKQERYKIHIKATDFNRETEADNLAGYSEVQLVKVQLGVEGSFEFKDSGVCFQDSLKENELSLVKPIPVVGPVEHKGLRVRNPNVFKEAEKPAKTNMLVDSYLSKENILNEDCLPNPVSKKDRVNNFIEYTGPGFTSALKPIEQEHEIHQDTGKQGIKICRLQEYCGPGLTSVAAGKVFDTVEEHKTVKDSAFKLSDKIPMDKGILINDVPVEGSAKATVFQVLKTLSGEGSTRSQSQSEQYTSGSTLQQFSSGCSSALKPDDMYPSLTSSKGDDNSATEKTVSHKVLQCQGQLKVSAYMNFGLLTVHVVQGRQLTTKWKPACDSFVKMSIIPDDGKKPKCKTDIVRDSNNPVYDEKFSFELNDEDHKKRLLISVWHRDQNAGVNEFLGCMSFGIRHLTNPKKEVSGWYYLLTEEIGKKKHLQVSQRLKPQLKVRTQSNIPAVNKDVLGMDSMQIRLQRGKNGFGFSVVEACPVRVGRVDRASPAESAGLQPGDIIIKLNKQNVSRSTATSVAKLVKHSSNILVLDIQRQRPVTFEHLENSPWKSAPVSNGNHGNNSDDEEENTMPQVYTIADDMKENEISVDEDVMYPVNADLAELATSTPLPLLARGHRILQTSEMRKQEAIHRLVSLELDFIDLMHAGMQRYSRPLRHCILSHTQHAALFQNIEKLTIISEYHVKQMHDNAPSSFMSEDTDESTSSEQHNFVNSVGMIYHSKVHMLCQAYDLYAKGLQQANQILLELQHSADFTRFIHEPQMDGQQPSISQFIYRPVQHIRELYRVLQEIYLNTSQNSGDFGSLKQVVEGLQECTNNITNYSCERVESMSSLASRETKSSFTGSSMKSRSSSSCSSTSSRSKQTGASSMCSFQTSKSVDMEVMRIQDRLIFPSNIPVFQLCQDERHVIFSGDMFKWNGQQWIKLHLILFTDILLQTVKEADGYLRVLQEPLMLRDLAGIDATRTHGTDFILHSGTKGQSSRKIKLRAPSTEQKYAWKSLIEQRVFTVRGSVEYFSSSSDVSNGSAASAIII